MRRWLLILSKPRSKSSRNAISLRSRDYKSLYAKLPKKQHQVHYSPRSENFDIAYTGAIEFTDHMEDTHMQHQLEGDDDMDVMSL